MDSKEYEGAGSSTGRNIRLKVATGQIQGSRERQEDSYRVIGNGEVVIALVADGLGGHAHGDLASQETVTAASEALARLGMEPDAIEPGALRKAFLEAHVAVRALDHGRRSWRGPASTLSAGVFLPDAGVAWLASIGDSPVLLLREGELELLTGQGELDGSVLYCLGGDVGDPDGAGVEVKDEPFELCVGDRILIASDGIFTLSEAQLVDGMSAADARGVVERILTRVIAEADRSQDNCTVIAIEVLGA